MHFTGAVLIGVVSAAVAALAALGGVLAQTDLTSGENVGLLVTGGSASIAATSLGYVVRQVASGQLVHRDVARAEEAYRDLATRAQEQNSRYAAFIDSRLNRES